MSKKANSSAAQTVGFICDTVRQEANGKVSLIGIQAGTIASPAFPTMIACGIFIRVTPPPEQDTEFTVRICLGDKSLAEIKPRMPSIPPSDGSPNPSLHLVMDRFILRLPEPGELRLMLRVGDKDFVELAAVQYSKAEQA